MKMFARMAVAAVAFIVAVTVFGWHSTAAQIPDEFKNLKVLPKDIGKRELVEIMRSFSLGLDVRCSECHKSTVEGSDELEDLDFASDDKSDKKTAREMMKMVGSINDQISKMNLEDPPRVQCVTCHHGVKSPRTLQAVMMREVNKGGVDAGIEHYRKLRADYYGSASYDFSPDALIEVAVDVGQSNKDFDGAVKFLNLNLEFHPNHARTYAMLGRVYLVKGDKAAAITSLEKALELDPDERSAKQLLERAKSEE